MIARHYTGACARFSFFTPCSCIENGRAETLCLDIGRPETIDDVAHFIRRKFNIIFVNNIRDVRRSSLTLASPNTVLRSYMHVTTCSEHGIVLSAVMGHAYGREDHDVHRHGRRGKAAVPTTWATPEGLSNVQ